jgi:predicted Abi (CAAX) family protease
MLKSLDIRTCVCNMQWHITAQSAGMLKLEGITIPTFGEVVEQRVLLQTVWNETSKFFGKVVAFYELINVRYSSFHTVEHQSAYSRQLKVYVHVKTCESIFIPDFFMVSPRVETQISRSEQTNQSCLHNGVKMDWWLLMKSKNDPKSIITN